MTMTFKAAREAAGFDQASVARLAGVSQATVSRIEAGKQTPLADQAVRLARALGVTVEDIWGELDPNTITDQLQPTGTEG